MTKSTCHSTSVATASSRVRWAEKTSGKLVLLTLLVTLLISVGCTTGSVSSGGSTGSGGTSSTPPPPPSAANELPVVVGAGVGPNLVLNRPLVSVTVCLPGTSNCQIIDNVLLDSGSTGLRVFSSVLTLPVTLQQQPPDFTVYECVQFENFYAWGPVAAADVQLSGETAPGVAIHLMGDTTYSPTSSCTNGLSAASSPQTVGFNGILGVSGQNDYSCSVNSPTPCPLPYSYCTSTDGRAPFCTPTPQPPALQVWNPVALFPTDNNGVVLDLPAVSGSGAANVQGSLYFGIGTEANNQLGSAVQFQLPLTAVVGDGPYPGGIDTGTSYIGILDDTVFGFPTCGVFYCPSSPTPVGLEIIGANEATYTGQVVAADPTPELDEGLTADPTLVGPGFNGNTVVLGLPFFYGHKVFLSIAGQNASNGSAPYVAF